MKPNCAAVEDALWESARGGGELSDDVMRHIRECEECARAAVETGASLALLARAKACPEAPDCRSAVASAIVAKRARPLRWAWALGAAVVLVAVYAAVGFLWPPPQAPRMETRKQPAPVPQVVKQEPPKPVPIAKQPAPPAWSEPEQPPAPQPRERRTGRVFPPVKKRSGSAQVAKQPDRRAPRPAPPEVRPDEPRPIAVVLVTWDANQTPSDSYEYSRTDPETGVTTTCKVTETNGVAEVDMRTSPSPNKGDTNETIPGV